MEAIKIAPARIYKLVPLTLTPETTVAKISLSSAFPFFKLKICEVQLDNYM